MVMKWLRRRKFHQRYRSTTLSTPIGMLGSMVCHLGHLMCLKRDMARYVASHRQAEQGWCHVWSQKHGQSSYSQHNQLFFHEPCIAQCTFQLLLQDGSHCSVSPSCNKPHLPVMICCSGIPKVFSLVSL